MLTAEERLLVESIKGLLQQPAKLGLEQDDKADDDNDPKRRGQGYLHGHINDLFHSKAADLTHYDGVCCSFAHVHNYKAITDPQFGRAMDDHMKAQGIPGEERRKALGIIDKIIGEVGDGDTWVESDYGFNQDLDEMLDR